MTSTAMGVPWTVGGGVLDGGSCVCAVRCAWLLVHGASVDVLFDFCVGMWRCRCRVRLLGLHAKLFVREQNVARERERGRLVLV